MSKTIQKKKGTGELPLFRSLTMFLNILTPIVLQMQKDIKVTFGHNLLNESIGLVNVIRKSYKTNDKKKKLDSINRIIDILENSEILLKIIFELGHISEKQMANLSINIADLLAQTNGWKTSVEKQIMNESNTNL